MIRVVTYNVSGGLDTSAVASVLRRIDPTIVCLLERPGGGRLRTVARECNLEVVARAGRKGSGSAILADDRVRVLASAHVPLSVPKEIPTREATQAIVGVDGLRLSITAVQFGLRPDVRRTNCDELSTYLDSIDLPKIIGADLNESARSPVAALLAGSYQDAYRVAGGPGGETYPTNDPSTRQDFLFVDHRLRVITCRVPNQPPIDVASHHRPVVAEIEGVAIDPQPAEEDDHS